MADLKPKQWKALRLIADGSTQAAAAAACGVTTRTVENWVASRDFQAALRGENQRRVTAARQRLLPLLGKAVSAYDAALECAENPRAMAVRLSAARDLLDRVGLREDVEEEDFVMVWRRRRAEYADLTEADLRLGEVTDV